MAAKKPSPKKPSPSRKSATPAPKSTAKKSPPKAKPAVAPRAAPAVKKAPSRVQAQKAAPKTAPLAAKTKAPASSVQKTAAKPVSKPPAKPAAKILPAPAAKKVLRPESAAEKSSQTNGHAQAPRPAVKAKPFTDAEYEKFRKLLLDLRDRLVGDIKFLTTDNLHRAGRETGADLSGASQHSADHGTDNFDREFALSLATTEQDVLFEVDEALMRIQERTYGVCEFSGVQIERARLEVIPYTRLSVQAQSRLEQSRARYRPFGQTFKAW